MKRKRKVLEIKHHLADSILCSLGFQRKKSLQKDNLCFVSIVGSSWQSLAAQKKQMVCGWPVDTFSTGADAENRTVPNCYHISVGLHLCKF